MKHIYLHCDELKDIDGSIDYVTYNKFIREFHDAEKDGKPIIVHVNTIGGEWESGLGMYDLIDLSKSEVTMIGYGCMWSMGSILMQAADKRYLTPHCNFMVHWGWSSSEGTLPELRTQMKYHDKAAEQMMKIYVDRCVKGKYFKEKGSDHAAVLRFLKDKLRTDWYMSAEEAVYYGFADKVLTKTTYNNARTIKKRTS